MQSLEGLNLFHGFIQMAALLLQVLQLLGDGRILLVHRFNQLQRVLNGQED